MKNQTILIVEDDPDTQKLLEFYIQKEGYKTFTAANGREAISRLKAVKPDLVVLDLMLPEVHGITICSQIKTDPKTKHIKVLMISVKKFSADRNQATEAGADLFMPKPLDRVVFMEAVDRLLGNDGKA